tara:strand:+ start:412 stop:1236 length:825 start_codon:yes stop_codon:yes gene_type:complete
MIIQSLWYGSDLTLLEFSSIESFIRMGYEFHLYTYDTVKNIPDNCRIMDANTIIPKSELFNEHNSILPFSDIWRFMLLYKKGGIWADLDCICLKKIDCMITADLIFASERTMKSGAYKSKLPMAPSINFIYTRYANEEIFKDLYDIMIKRRGKMRNDCEGMRVIKDYLKKYPKPHTLLEPKIVNNINWWDVRELYYDKPFKTKYGWEPDAEPLGGRIVHLWRNKFRILQKTRTKNTLDINSPIPFSIYDTITEKYIEAFEKKTKLKIVYDYKTK